MAVKTTAEALVESLLLHGIDTVYGIPGMHNDPLFDAFYRAGDQLRVIHPRHEQATAYMALGAAMATGKPQAYSVVPGPGFLNSTAALLNAYGVNAPVLCLTGQIAQAEIERYHGGLHEIRDQLGIAGHMTKFAARINAPHEAPYLVRDALRVMLSGRQRPGFLECPLDVWGQKSEIAMPLMPAALDRIPVDADAVEAAARLLGAAKRPLIVVGGGAMEAGAEITALAEMLEAPVVSWRRGKGVVASSHRLSVFHPEGHALWKTADVVLAIGTRFHLQQSSWGVDKDLKIIRLDIDPEEPARYLKPAVALVGEARDYAAALLARVPAHNGKRESRTDELAALRQWYAGQLATLQPQLGYLKAIRRALPVDGIFVDEVTQMGFAARLGFPVEQPRTFLTPGYQDNLGWGYGTALGVKAAMPDRAVLSIAGDGGFFWQVGELATAAQHKLGVVVVVFDNASFGNVKLIQKNAYGGRHIACDFVNPDFVKLAESFNIAAYRATTPDELERTLTKAFADNVPALVHVPIGECPSPWKLIQRPKVRG
ncbi:MAG TPA: thiamine pyrophosphate-dependent enzyme [Stellaceae bacterium]|nr:thiamine pyrophosphate-dependent enzyme [Stellaceae bacterium]